MKIKSLIVKNFRHIENQTIEFGEKLTVLSGQNSTGKSSLLGWVAQACDFKGKEKTLTQTSFKTKYSEIFRFCEQYDYRNNYEIILEYCDGEELKSKTMKTRYEKTEKRYRVDFDGRGKAINFPILYLGLKRLIPLATERDIVKKSINLEEDEKNIFSKLSKEILILMDKEIKPEQIKSTNKEFLAMQTSIYSHLGNSAGQDNIGQIITALLSFRRLKNIQKDRYNGGIILIDELDATLYAGAQIKLINNLFGFARNLDLQIIFTTHSLEILDMLSEKLGNDTKINFLELKDKKIENILNPSIQWIRDKIKVQIKQKKEIKKIDVLCEDDVTALWCKNLINGTEYKNKVNVIEASLPDGTLSTMANNLKNKIFTKFLYILDGDCRKNYITRRALPPRTMILPGEYRPETIFYNFLYDLSDSDTFWDDANNFTKQTCFVEYRDGQDKGVVKKWFKDKNIVSFFGRGYSRLFNRWKKENIVIVKKFQEDFKKIIYL